MNPRRTAGFAVLALIAAPAAAQAAPSARAKTVCNLITDVEGDGGLRLLTYDSVTVNSAAMDIVGADFATGAKTIVAKIKLVGADPDPQSLPKVTYAFAFQVKGTDYTFTMVRDTQAGTTESSFSAGSVNGTFANNVITFVTSRTNVKGLSTRGQKVSELRATSANDSVLGLNADTTNRDPKLAYVDRTPSCLKPA